jgi:predicted O-methyltransferase YrrM
MIGSRRRFDYDRALLANSLLRELEEGVSSVEEALARSYLTPGYPGWNLLYYLTYCSLRPDGFNVIVETGANWGCSTIVLAQALRDCRYLGKVYSVEISAENIERAEANLHAASLLDCVELSLGDSVAYLADPPFDKRLIRVAFLDSLHKCEHVLAEFEQIYPQLDEAALVIFDNTASRAEGEEAHVFTALKRIRELYGGNLVNFENVSWQPPGQAVWQKGAFPGRK